MVAHTPKWNLPVEATGDPADMPAASGRMAAAVEAALDRVTTQYTAADRSRVAKSGDTMTGPLVIDASGGGGALFYNAGVGYRVGVDPGLGNKLGIATVNPSGQVTGTALTIDQARNTVVNGLTVSADVHFPGVPQSLGAGEIADSTHAVMRMADGTLKTFTRIAFGLWQNINPSSRRFKRNIRPAAPAGVLGVETVTFEYLPEVSGDTATHLGVIAEQVAEVFPQAVVVGADGLPEGVDQMALIAGLIHVVKAQEARITDLEEDV